MAIKQSIASNHLSRLASKGRYGDTQIAKTSQGELWHVNPEEKAIMNMYGMEGEKLVDAVGSGTINPDTGLEEKFDPFTIASLGLGIYSAYKGVSSRRQQAENEIGMAAQGERETYQAEQKLRQAKGARVAAASQDYSLAVDELSAETGIAREDLKQSTTQAIERTGGLVTSGVVTEKESTMWDRISDAYGRGQEGLLANLGKAQGDISSWYEGEKSRLSRERKKFQNMRKIAEQQSEEKFLGIF